MNSYILRRILQAVATTLFLSFFCYFLLTLMPGDPVELMASANPDITPEDVQRLRELYDLDKPFYYRYSNWMAEILKGDLGYSRTYNVPVSQIIGPRLLNTFVLATGSVVFAVLIGVGAGIIAAVRRGSIFDYAVNFAAFAAFSIPAFWLAIMLIIIFAVWIPFFPAGGTETIGMQSASFFDFILDRIKYLALPMTSLTLIQIGAFARYSRSSMIDTLHADYLNTARAKGVSEWRVVFIHGLRNAILPIVTVVSISFGFVFSGAILTETVFSYQGIGKLIYDSIIANDFNVAMICLMISIVMVLIMSIIGDILIGIFDPRVRLR